MSSKIEEIELLSDDLDRRIDNGMAGKERKEAILRFLRKCRDLAKYVPTSKDYEHLIAVFHSWEAYYKILYNEFPDVDLKLYTKKERDKFIREAEEIKKKRSEASTYPDISDYFQHALSPVCRKTEAIPVFECKERGMEGVSVFKSQLERIWDCKSFENWLGNLYIGAYGNLRNQELISPLGKPKSKKTDNKVGYYPEYSISHNYPKEGMLYG